MRYCGFGVFFMVVKTYHNLPLRFFYATVVVSTFDAAKRGQLKDLVHSNPREYGQPRTTWSLSTLAQVAYQEGITPTLMSIETIRQALKADGISWRRAKAWISSPDPDYERKKRRRARLIQKADAQSDWLLMFLDEVWWSRLLNQAYTVGLRHTNHYV
jgi:hypothetical protein